jgi:hypothetical protein
MNEPNDPLLLDHEADGIKELDNNLPQWWVWLFYLTIAFAVIYMGYYHIIGTETCNWPPTRNNGRKGKRSSPAP